MYFGFPQAHEDDAERAVRAALGLVEAVPLSAAPWRISACADWNRYWRGRGRRHSRIGNRPGASRRWRNTQPGFATTEFG